MIQNLDTFYSNTTESAEGKAGDESVSQPTINYVLVQLPAQEVTVCMLHGKRRSPHCLQQVQTPWGIQWHCRADSRCKEGRGNPYHRWFMMYPEMAEAYGYMAPTKDGGDGPSSDAAVKSSQRYSRD